MAGAIMSGCQTREENAADLAREENAADLAREENAADLAREDAAGWQVLLDGQIVWRDGAGKPFIYATRAEAEAELARYAEEETARFGEGALDGCNYTIERVQS
jgi:hypothetical protein